MTSHEILRIIDANLNRTGEGLRVLEEIARLLLNDEGLTQRLKNMRHGLLRADIAFNRDLLDARDSVSDVGASMDVPGEKQEKGLPDIVVANSRRVQESLRVLEEMAKTPGLDMDSDKFRQARFGLYTIEQELLSRLLRQEKAKQVRGLYVIIDTQALRGRDPLAVTEQVIRGGAKVIQLRDKTLEKKDLLPLAIRLKELCARHNILFIMNDYLDLALAVKADGLHVGQRDLPVSVARRLVPLDMILGCSTGTVEQSLAARADGADYVGVGAIYPSPTKEVVSPLGTERLRQVKQAVPLPLVAIGGITKDNGAEVIAAGADSICVISAVLGAASPEEAARQIAVLFEEK